RAARVTSVALTSRLAETAPASGADLVFALQPARTEAPAAPETASPAAKRTDAWAVDELFALSEERADIGLKERPAPCRALLARVPSARPSAARRSTNPLRRTRPAVGRRRAAVPRRPRRKSLAGRAYRPVPSRRPSATASARRRARRARTSAG